MNSYGDLIYENKSTSGTGLNEIAVKSLVTKNCANNRTQKWKIHETTAPSSGVYQAAVTQELILVDRECVTLCGR